MAINKKLIYYNRTLNQLKSDANGLNNQTTKDGNGNVGNIPFTSIVFTNDGYFWTHGKVFNCNNTSAVTSVNGKSYKANANYRNNFCAPKGWKICLKAVSANGEIGDLGCKQF